MFVPARNSRILMTATTVPRFATPRPHSRAQADVEILSAQLSRQQAVIDQADATIRADEATLTFAKANATRYRNLSQGGAVTVEQQQQSASQLQQAIATKERDT